MPWARSDLSKYQNHWRGWRDWSLCVVPRHFYEKRGPDADNISKFTLKATMLSSDFFQLHLRRVSDWLGRSFTFWKKAMWKSGKGLASGESFYLDCIGKTDRYAVVAGRPPGFSADVLPSHPTEEKQATLETGEGEEADQSDDGRQSEWPTMMTSSTSGMSVNIMLGHIPHVLDIPPSASLLLLQYLLVSLAESLKTHPVITLAPELFQCPILFTRRFLTKFSLSRSIGNPS